MKQTKKELIRETAIQVIAELGFHSATTDRIAAEAGVSVGTIYNYFRSKEEILEYIFQVELDKRSAYYRKLQEEALSVQNRIERLLSMHFTAISENPAVGKILVREQPSPMRHGFSTAITEFVEGIPVHISKLLDEGIARGEIRPCNTLIAALAMFGAVGSVVHYAVGQNSANEQPAILRQAARELVEFYFKGLSI